jgi:hypothetical protein
MEEEEDPQEEKEEVATEELLERSLGDTSGDAFVSCS